MTEGFSGKQAAEIVGITYRQLDYWARTDLIRPSLADAQGQRKPPQVLLPRPARAQGRSRPCSTRASGSNWSASVFEYLRATWARTSPPPIW